LTPSTASYDSDMLSNRIFESHAQYCDPTLTYRRITQNHILPLIELRKKHPFYCIEEIGTSFEGRPIQMVQVGNGSRRILLWSQMHGDEATATMASFDILNFLEGKDDGLDAIRNKILSETTLYFIPMLNPDGAQRFQRRNAQDIDINRDALALQAPESRILKDIRGRLQPEFGFNLHDKNPRYSVGNSDQLATISFLATAYDAEKNVNEVRRKSMQLIAGMNRTLQNFIPNQIGRWSEDFEPRAFGDNIQKWGTTLILIESGGYAGDPEKQYIRKLNYVALISGLYSIAENTYPNEDIAEYYAIPENARYIYDLLIRQVTVSNQVTSYQMDLGINRNEVNINGGQSFYYQSIVEDLGDLSIFHGTQTLDATGYQFVPGKIYPTPFKDLQDCEPKQAWDLLRRGYTSIYFENTQQNIPNETFPLQIVTAPVEIPEVPTLDQEANFFLTKAGIIKYAVVNGFLFDLELGVMLPIKTV
jgi:hypothetical protein